MHQAPPNARSIAGDRTGGRRAYDERLFATFLPARPNVIRHAFRRNCSPFDIEAAAVSKERSPDAVPHVNHDSEAPFRIVVPLPNAGDSAEQHWKPEADDALVKSLRSRAEPKASLVIDRQVDIDGQVFVRAKVIDDAAARLAVNHVRVEAPRATRHER